MISMTSLCLCSWLHTSSILHVASIAILAAVADSPPQPAQLHTFASVALHWTYRTLSLFTLETLSNQLGVGSHCIYLVPLFMNSIERLGW